MRSPYKGIKPIAYPKWKADSKFRKYHTPSTVPECVRPEVVKGWDLLWRRLRRYDMLDKRAEFRSGTKLTIGGVDFTLVAFTGSEVFEIALYENTSRTRIIPGNCAKNLKPYTYLDDLQKAVDELLVESILGSSDRIGD